MQQGYPPQQVGYYPAPTAVVHPVVVNNVSVCPVFGDYPVSCTCPLCGHTGMTAVQKEVGMMAWIGCLVIFLAGCLILAWVPLVLDICKDSVHHCGACGRPVGSKKAL